MYLLFIWRRCNEFDGGISIYRATGKGGPRKIETFLGPEIAMSEVSATPSKDPFSPTGTK